MRFGCDICFDLLSCIMFRTCSKPLRHRPTNRAQIVLKSPPFYTCDFKIELARDKNCVDKCDKNYTKTRLCKRALWPIHAHLHIRKQKVDSPGDLNWNQVGTRNLETKLFMDLLCGTKWVQTFLIFKKNILGSFCNDDGGVNENVQKRIRCVPIKLFQFVWFV